MRYTAVALLVIAVLLPARAEAKWTEVRSASFLFVGDAPEGQIRDIARKLEQFREVMLRALPGAATGSPVPTVVLVCATGRTLRPMRPLYRGSPIEVAGFFQSGEDVNYMVINAELADAALPTVFHEYSHALVGNTFGRLPVWVGEGLAEVYETMEQQRGGRSALLGRPQPYHLALLNRSTLIPIRDLTAVDHESPMYNEGTRRGVLYAQSWALVHYLTFGSPARADQFRQFLSALRAGGDAATLFASAFGTDGALDRELFDYVRRFSFPAMRFDFADRVAGGEIGRGRTLADLDAGIYIADLQHRIGRGDEARVRLQAVLEQRPDAARALVAQGMAHLRGDRIDQALPVLERAAALAPDDPWAQSAFGRALLARLGNQLLDERAAALLRRSRDVLTRAVELDAESAFAAAMLGYVELALGTDLPRATSLLERAVRLAPSRDQYRLFLGQSLIRRGDFAGAEAVLRPLASAARGDELGVRARAILANLAERRNEGAAGAAPAVPAADLRELAGVTRSVPLTGAAPRPSDGPSQAVPDTARAGAARADETPLRPGPLLRPVGAGESRVLGQLRAVECAGASVVLLVESAAGTLRLRATAIDDVDFISYRTDALPAVSCGELSGSHRVLATYRPGAEGTGAAATAGDAVAIELLPDGFTPR